MNAPVVVGVDDPEHSAHAMTVAAREARIRKAPLWLAHAYYWIPPVALTTAVGCAAEEAVRGSAASMLDEAADRIRAGHPGLAVETVPVGGHAPQSLADVSEGAALLVVGSRGRGGFPGQLLGSVSLRVLSRSRCPVMVVRGEPAAHDTGRIAVGVDVAAPGGGPRALEFAFDEAVLRKAGVYAAHAWEDNRYLYLATRDLYLAGCFDDQAADRRRRLETLLEPWQTKYSGVRTWHQMLPGSPAKVLADLSRLVDLIVLGGGVRDQGHDGMRIGALDHTVLRHAHCPVVVVPER